MDTTTHISKMNVPRPSFEAVEKEYAKLWKQLDARDYDGALRGWDALRRDLGTYGSLARLRFSQDTTDDAARKEREFADEFFPRIEDFETKFKRHLIAHKSALAPKIGTHVFDLWNADVASFEPALEADLVRESKVASKHPELSASARIEFDGGTYNLSQLRKFTLDPDRDVRHRGEKARWAWFAEHAEEFDSIYDELVETRTKMARELGHENYVPLGYLRRQRIDYDAADVARFRREVRQHVVPIAQAIIERQAQTLGVDEVMVWDEAVFDPDGGPGLTKSGDELLAAAQTMFDSLHPDIGVFFKTLNERGLLDLEARNGKAPGGFCTTLENWDAPFVFANFNGTRGDVEVFTHEMGHAFQCFSSMKNFPCDLIWPTLESCEIHSMSLEFLCWPHMELFFGDEADRFRRAHLAESLTFLPYGCAVDHFQHLIYEHPDASVEDRYEMWQEMEALYLPWRNWGDIDHGANGGRWHGQGHIFSSPFYYIDYVLAMTCALQFWDRSQRDFQGSMDAYVELCRRGGEAPFQELARSAGLRSPFEEGCLESAAARAREYLDL